MPAIPPRALSLALVVLLAGCVAPTPTPDATEEPEPTTASTTPVTTGPKAPSVVVTGVFSRNATMVRVNLSLYNQGSEAVSYSKHDCQASPWDGNLSGPPGNDFHYHEWIQTMGCPGEMGRLEAKAWLNQTYDGPFCTNRNACVNKWEGRVYPIEKDNEWHPAPAGNYTWVFTFRYYDAVMTGATANPGHAPHSVTKTFTFTWP